MDHRRFDDFTRLLAAKPNRRTVLRRLAGGAVGGIAVLAARGTSTAATCRQRGDACSAPEIGTQGRCCEGLRCSGTTAGGGARCIGPNQCECPDGESCINFACCPNNQICGGQCLAAPCLASECNACNTQTGTCEFTCAADQTCDNGTCTGGGGTGLCGFIGDECTVDGDCCEQLRCNADGICVGTVDKGETCRSEYNVCKTGLRCCSNTIEGPGAVCVDVICKQGFREQGGYPNGPRCECCANGQCSPGNVKCFDDGSGTCS